MLYLVRKLGESIIINDTIEVKVMEIKGRSVKLGFEFPSSATVLRKEIHDRVVQENISAQMAQLGADDFTDAISGLGGTNFNREKSAEVPSPAAAPPGNTSSSRLTLSRNKGMAEPVPPVPDGLREGLPDGSCNAKPDA